MQWRGQVESAGGTVKSLPSPVGPGIVEFATGKAYLGKGYLSVAQIAILKAIYGEVMTAEEKSIFLAMTEGRQPNPRGYDEACIVCGMRGGKTLIASIVATYESVRWAPTIGQMLEPGQTCKGILIAQDERGANEARSYIEGNLKTLEEKYGNVLAQTVGQERAITGESIRLHGPVEIVIYPAKKHSVKGATGLWFIGDEIASWEKAEGAYNQDKEVMRAVRSRFATLARIRPKRLMISSPDEKHGELWEVYKRRETCKALVVNAPTWDLYPGISREFLDDAQERDPESYLRDFGAQFTDVGAGGNAFLDAETIDQCVRRGSKQIPPKPGTEYLAVMDAGFKRDRFFLGIAHAERNGEAVKVIVDQVRYWTPAYKKGSRPRPLDPKEVEAEVVAELRFYGVDRIYGDQYADVPLKSDFQALGVMFMEAPASNPEKVEAFKNLRAALRAKLVDLPDDEATIRDLKGLIKRVSPTGSVQIAAPRRQGCYDDGATVVSRLVQRLMPMSSCVDLAEYNARAIARAGPSGLDYTPPGQHQENDYGVGLWEAVY